MTDADTDDTTIPTNMRLLMLLEEVANAGVPVTPTEVLARVGLPKSTVHRLFATLEREGFLQRDIDGKSFSPGARLRRFSANVLSSQRVRMARVAILSALADEIGETCNVAIPDRDGMIYLDRIETKWPLRIQLPVGSRVPFHATASGKLYLSTIQRAQLASYLKAAPLEALTAHTLTDAAKLTDAISTIAEQGYSTDDEEFMDGMVAISVPLLDSRKRLLATLSVHAPTSRMSSEDLRNHLPRLRDAASELMVLLRE